MCIRDRAREDEQERRLPRLSAGVALRVLESTPEGHQTSPPPRYTCLLYTSDAADDLLCVDLGGRRSIKKKKIKKTKTTHTNTPSTHQSVTCIPNTILQACDVSVQLALLAPSHPLTVAPI